MDMKKTRNYNRPARHTDSSNKDATAVDFVSYVIERNGQVAASLNKRDSYPNTDGFLELTTSDGDPESWLVAQVKPLHPGKRKITYTFDDDKFITYCKSDHGLPIIFIGVDIDNEKAYWREMTPDYAKSLSSLTIEVPPNNLISLGNTDYVLAWKVICDTRKKLYEEAKIASARGVPESSPSVSSDPNKSAIVQLFDAPIQSKLLQKNIDAVNSIVENLKEKILLYEGHLFLVSPTYVNNSDIRKIIRSNVGITLQQEELFIDELTEKGILSKTGDVVVFADDSLGQEKLTYLINQNLLDVSKIYSAFENANIREAILRRIVSLVDVPSINNFLSELAGSLLEEVNTLRSNDDIVLKLQLLGEYSFRTPEETVDIAKKILSASAIPPKTYDSEWGKVEGANNEKVVLQVIDTLKNIRYLKLNEVLEISLDLCSSEYPEVKKRALELIKNISEYNLFAMRKIGYFPQRKVADYLLTLTEEQLVHNLNAVTEIGKEVLNFEFEGSQMTDYKTFTLSFGPLKPSDELAKIRDDVSEVIKRLVLIESTAKAKIELLNILEIGGRTPTRGEYSEELEALILAYVDNLLQFYISIVAESELTVIHEIESQLNIFTRRFTEDKLSHAKDLQLKLRENKQYELFKIFYGYDFDFDKLPWREAREKREKIIQELLDDISKENFKKWKADILVIAANYSYDDPGKFQYFNNFLYKLSKKEPTLAKTLLGEETLKPFLTHIIQGLWESGLHSEIRTTLLSWADEGKNLNTIAELFWFTRTIDTELLEKVFKSAKEVRDLNTLTILARNIAISYKGEHAAKALFFTVIKELTIHKSTNWVFNFFLNDSDILKGLSENQIDILFQSLLLVEDINHDSEEILIPVADNHPQKVVQFFYIRIKKQLAKEKDSRYDAIPYDFHELNKTLAKHSEIVLNESLKWFEEEEWLFQFDAPRFINEVFPALEEPLKSKLLQLITTGGSKNADIVLKILRAYKGETFLHEVVKAFIKKFLRGDKSQHYKDYKTELFIILSTTGVVSGEYGLPNAYKQKKEEVQNWKSDKSKLVQQFVAEYEDYLDKNIVYHTKRADEDIEIMKRGGK